jgi:hypothetical protein
VAVKSTVSADFIPFQSSIGFHLQLEYTKNQSSGALRENNKITCQHDDYVNFIVIASPEKTGIVFSHPTDGG